MRKTVREQYREALVAARNALRGIREQLEQSGDLMRTQRALLRWQDETALVIARYEGSDAAMRFREHYDFDPVGLTGQYVADGITTYDDLLVTAVERPRLDVKLGYDDDVR